VSAPPPGRARARRALALALVAAFAAPAAAQTPRGEGDAFLRGEDEGRAYRLFLPARPAPAAPLVVALHGCWQTPEDFALGTRLNEAARARGLAVLYPAQGRFDNPYRCWNWFLPGNQSATGGESGWILGLARRVRDARGLRAPRLVVLGFSAGAFMAVNLACAAPARVAGLGAIAGGAFRCGTGAEGAIQCMRGLPQRDPTGSAVACLAAGGGAAPDLRVSLWHGARDSVVSPANLTGLEAMFARVLGASDALTEPAAGAVRATYRARGAPVLETWLVTGMGHAWSGGDARATHTWPPGPPATERMLDFLLSSGGASAAPLGEGADAPSRSPARQPPPPRP